MLSFSRERTAFTQASLFKKGHMSYVMALAITNVFFRINFNSLWSEWLERIKKNVSEHYYFSIHVAKTKANYYVSGLHYINRYVMIFQLKFEHMQAKTTTLYISTVHRG